MQKRVLRAILPLLLWICFSFGSILPPTLTACADTPKAGDYACILQDETFFYAVPEEKRGVFLLPKTYYVQLVEYGETFCKIDYLTDDGHVKKLTGYARTEALTFVDYVPERPYLYYVFDVKYKIDETETTDSTFLTQLTVTCAYYGDYVVGSQVYCYVLRGEEFGYIPKPENLQFEENTEYADRQQAQEETTSTPSNSDSADTASGGFSTLQILLLVGLCILVPIVAAFILKPKPEP